MGKGRARGDGCTLPNVSLIAWRCPWLSLLRGAAKMRRRFLIPRQPDLLCEQTRRFICIAWVGVVLVVWVGS